MIESVQITIMHVCIVILGCMALTVLAAAIRLHLLKFLNCFMGRGRFDTALALIAICGMVAYGSTKPTPPPVDPDPDPDDPVVTQQVYTVTFDANGGEGGWSGVLDYGSAISAPAVTYIGHTLAGWTPEVPATVPASNATYVAKWQANRYKAVFDANGGAGGKTVTQAYGTPLSAPAVARVGYVFTGWSPELPTAMPAGDVTFTAGWSVGKYSIVFDANGGTGGMTNELAYGGAIAAPAVVRVGFTLVGWSPEVPATVPASNATYEARWQVNRYKIVFDANGGEGGWSRLLVFGTELEPPVPGREGYKFTGWKPVVPATVGADDATYVAQWEKIPDPEPKPGPGPDPKPQPEPDPDTEPVPEPAPKEVYVLYKVVDGAVPAAAASEYNGYLIDADGAVRGSVQVKVGKPNAKTGIATVKATAVIGTKKVTLKGADKGKAVIAADGPTEIALAGGDDCEIVLGAEAFSGTYGAYAIDGARNFFTSKTKAEVTAANGVLSKWLGSFMVILDGGSLNINVAAKGKVKVSGTLADGKTKVSANSMFLIGEEWSCIPIVAQKANLAFALWLSPDGGTVKVEGLGDDVLVGKAGTLVDGARFRIVDDDEFLSVLGQDILPYLPDGTAVTLKGTKWTLPKAGKVVYRNGAVDELKLGENPCGLKLTYKAKDGTFKGSFKVYAVNGAKVKATTVNVTGFLLNGIGYGTATVKGKGSVAVTIDQ